MQHALRAFTPKDQKAVKTAAETFRPNKKFSAAEAIVELGVGEALVSFLDAKGVPTPVERCFVAPPRGRIGPVTDAERAAVIKASPLAGKYEQEVDRESAYEVLMGRADRRPGAARRAAADAERRPRRRGQYDAPPPVQRRPRRAVRGAGRRSAGRGPSPSPNRACARRSRCRPSSPVPKTPASRSDTITTTIVKSAARTATNIAVREASKAIFGSGRNAGILGQILPRRAGGLLK